MLKLYLYSLVVISFHVWFHLKELNSVWRGLLLRSSTDPNVSNKLQQIDVLEVWSHELHGTTLCDRNMRISPVWCECASDGPQTATPPGLLNPTRMCPQTQNDFLISDVWPEGDCFLMGPHYHDCRARGSRSAESRVQASPRWLTFENTWKKCSVFAPVVLWKDHITAREHVETPNPIRCIDPCRWIESLW